MLLLFLLLPLLSQAVPEKCSLIPWDMWCGDGDLETVCGFKEQCEGFRSATKNKPLQLTLLMEAFCPGCQAFIVEVLYPTIYKHFPGFVDIEIVPFGNAKVKNGTIYCQHGQEECDANKFESCFIDTVKNQKIFVPYLYCLESQLQTGADFKNAVKICYEQLSVTDEVQKRVKNCISSDLGNQLQQKAAERTDKVWPEGHRWVPWFMFNNVSMTSFQNQRDNLPALICKWYSGSKAIPACQNEMKKMLKEKKWSGSKCFN